MKPAVPRPARPSLRVERQLQRQGYRLLAGMDEVGRGALAGPVSVGVVVIDDTCRSAPAGVADSKLLPPARRQALVRPVRRWALACAVGHAGPGEIDAVGIIAALRLAARRALAHVSRQLGAAPDLVLLDGAHDWLSDPAEVGLFALLPSTRPVGSAAGSGPGSVAAGPDGRYGETPPVRTLVKADRTCSSVAAASIVAKVERDALVVELSRSHPQYGWDCNKGYAAPVHLLALAQYGPCAQHRRSWRLPGAIPTGGRVDSPALAAPADLGLPGVRAAMPGLPTLEGAWRRDGR